jgi:hypothetical protein
MQLPTPMAQSFSILFAEIEKGEIKIPQFQRDFVWGIQKSASLIDSIIKGYPIGSFILWKTKERLRSIKRIGGLDLPEPSPGEVVSYVLDGQQRLTSLFACLKGLSIQRDAGTDNFADIYINLLSKEDEQIVYTLSELKGNGINPEQTQSCIKVTELLYGDFTRLASFPKEYHAAMEKYKKHINGYNYAIIQIQDTPIDIATEIFTRINVSGQPLTLFQIMVAKTYEEKSFELSQKFSELIENLKGINYETLSDATVLQLIALILRTDCKRKTILELGRKEFIETWDNVVSALEDAAEYFRNTYRIPVSQLLPYNALFVPFAYFFYHRKGKPSAEQKRRLEDFFWRCSLSSRYSSAVEGKLAQDIKRIDLILQNESPDYDWPIDITANFIIQNGWFSASRSYIKAILCLYAFFEPKSFNDNSKVNISNDWLKQANSKNYHHFFPRAFLRARGIGELWINNVINITIVDDFLNKRKIRAQAPSIYMKTFADENPDLSITMRTHLIDVEGFGIATDDYDTFIQNRAAAVSEALRAKIIPRTIDMAQQTDLQYDYEEDAVD